MDVFNARHERSAIARFGQSGHPGCQAPSRARFLWNGRSPLSLVLSIAGTLGFMLPAVSQTPFLSEPLAESSAAPRYVSQAIGLLRNGDAGAAVERVQRALTDLGYYDGPISGYLGDLTETAIRQFQTDQGLPVDGVVGPTTESALFGAAIAPANASNSSSTAVRRGSTGARVFALQERLAELGYYQGAIDGDFGAGTESAVIAFQSNNGLVADGVVGPSTEAALRDSNAVSAIQASPAASPSAPASTFPTAGDGLLELGESGREVIALQTQLQSLGFYNGVVDGEYGPSTRDAVIAFQRSRGLVPDGVAGPQTIGLLDQLFFDQQNGQSATINPANSGFATPTTFPSPTTSAPAQQPTVFAPTTPRPLPPVQTAPFNTTPATTNELQGGRFSVLELQERLTEQGFYNGPINGILDANTRSAIRAAQQAYNLRETDILRGNF
jgi:peptidoglycan hydrolase-like protein with peptidoglycan-binding domain